MDRYAQGQPVHPTMLYESLLNFILFALLWKLRLRNFRDGMIGASYLLGYAAIRSLLTPLRMDNQYLNFGDSKILAPYAISVFMTLIALLWILKAKLWQQQPDLRGQVQDLRKPGKKTSKR